jgi:transketolase
MRHALSPLFLETADSDERFLVLSGDHGYELFDALRTRHPDRFVNVGVAEQSMIGIAAGLCRTGFRPCIYGLASFVPLRVLEQVKIDLCYGSLPVMILGDGAGLVYSALGVSHQCGEDVACLRPLPTIAIYSPCDAHELRACWNEARQGSHPSYLRIGKVHPEDIHAGPVSGTSPVVLCEAGPAAARAVIVATGAMVRVGVQFAALMAFDASPCRGSSPRRSNSSPCSGMRSGWLCSRSMPAWGGCGASCWNCSSPRTCRGRRGSSRSACAMHSRTRRAIISTR